MAIYFTSDLHFCHDREFLYKPRGFSNVYDMNKAIISNWNSVVSMEDDVYVLGDMMLNDDAEGIRCIKQLKGRIHIILGNHDTDNRIEKYNECYNVVEISYGMPLKYKKFHFFLSHYPALTANWDDGKKMYQKVINLCGHTHTKNPFADWDKGVIYHCELDAHDCTPVCIDKVIEDLVREFNK